MSDDTRDLIAEAFDRIEARLIGGSIFLSHSQADDLATLRAALEQRKPTLPDSELLATLRKHDEAMTAGEWRISEALGEGFAHVVYSGDAGVCRCDNNPRHESLKSPVDAEGIAALRNLLPRIIAALEQADERLRGVEEERKALAGRAELLSDLEDVARTFRATLDQRHTGGEG